MLFIAVVISLLAAVVDLRCRKPYAV